MRLHLNYVIRDRLLIDDEGADFASAEDGIEETKLGAREMLAAAIRGNNDNFPQSMSVVDDFGNILFEASTSSIMSDVFKATFARTMN